MADSHHSQLRRIFDLAVELPPEKRSELLDRLCAGNAELRRRVEAMLRAADDDRFLANPTAAGSEIPTRVPARISETPGERVGQYKLLQQIGEGGFGAVFLAEQQTPVVRRVALKIIKLGMDTRQVIARFEAERQALAMMDHPNIARVFDAGATDTGRPYFVMELVRGDPITAYCDKHNLSTDERLSLFSDVCHAIQHAHQKGIIHRDIKPSNVLVTVADGKPIPKVIDFGIAKAMHQRLTEKTLFTEHRALIGTPEYMSPEQAEMSGVDIDTRSDIYSLGVLLYELLTGVTPFDGQQLRSAAYHEIQRIIREVDPPKPSTRLSTLETLPSVAAHRKTEPDRLSRRMRGDLDWIVMKALEKDRTRRYETANGLALDVQRHLSGEAVTAAPPSTLYRVRKFVRKHKLGVSSGVAIAAVLLLGIAGTSAAMSWALRERSKAASSAALEKAQHATADANATRAADEAARASRERDKAEQVAAFMERTLEGVGPAVARGRDTTILREMMDSAAQRITQGELSSSPEAEVRLRLTIGRTYQDISAYDAARAMLEPTLPLAKSLPATNGDSSANVAAMAAWGDLLGDLGRDAEAERFLRLALEMCERLHRGDDERISAVLDSLACVLQKLGRSADAEKLYRRSLEMCERLFPDDHLQVARSRCNEATVLHKLARPAEAEVLFQRALAVLRREFPGDNPEVASVLRDLASVRMDLGHWEAAEPLCRESLEMARRLLPKDNLPVASTLKSLGSILVVLGDYSRALEFSQQALDMFSRLFPGDDARTAACLTELAFEHKQLGRIPEADALLNEADRMYRRLYPNDHPDRAATLNSQALMSEAMGRPQEAEALCRAALAMYQRLYPDGHTDTAVCMHNLARALNTLGRPAEAEPILRDALAMMERLLPAGNPSIAGEMRELAKALDQMGRKDEAVSLYRRSLDIYSLADHGDHPEIVISLNDLGLALVGSKPDEAQELLTRALDMRRRLAAGDDSEAASIMTNLGLARKALGHPDQAEPLFRDALGMRERLFAGNHPAVADSLYNLAFIRYVLERPAESKELLVRAVAMYRDVYPPDHPMLAISLGLLGDCHQATGNTREALASWRDAYAAQERTRAPNTSAMASTLAQHATRLLAVGTPEACTEAEAILRKCLTIRETLFPDGNPQQWLRYNSMSMLGGSFIGQAADPTIPSESRISKLRAAEPLVLRAFERLNGDSNVPSPAAAGGDRKREALDRVIHLYELWDKLEPGKGHDAQAAGSRTRSAPATDH